MSVVLCVVFYAGPFIADRSKIDVIENFAHLEANVVLVQLFRKWIFRIICTVLFTCQRNRNGATITMLLVDTEGTRSDRFGCDKVLRSSKLWFLSVFVVRTYEMPAIQVTRSARHRDRNNMDMVDVAHSFQPLIGHE